MDSTVSSMRARNASSAMLSHTRVSASTTSRSVPWRGSWLPNTATQPRRTPAMPPIASSIS